MSPFSDPPQENEFDTPLQARLRPLVDTLAENEKALAACYAERTRVLGEMTRLGNDPAIVAALRGDPVETGHADPDTATHGPAWEDEELFRRTIAAEAGGVLRVNSTTAGTMVFEAARLTRELPLFHRALSQGTITWGHALKMLALTAEVPISLLPGLEEKVLPRAEKLTSTQFLRVATKIVERMHPIPLQERTALGFVRRRVVLQPDADGMAWLNAYLKADEAHAIYDRLTYIAKNLDDADGDAAEQPAPLPRSRDQRRADAYRDLFLDGEGPNGLGRGIRGTVSVTVPVLTLLGKGNEPAMLEGYGPIDTESARKIAGTATSFTRILTHPETGCMLSVGRESYAVPADLRKYLQIRDETCQGIGCNRRATRSEIDHTQAWNVGGTTSADNLVHLCKACHRLKHQSSFSTSQTPDGVLTWTSPSGKKYTREPAQYIGRPPESERSRTPQPATPQRGTLRSTPTSTPRSTEKSALSDPPPF